MIGSKQVTSLDGTTIAFTVTGSGPGILIVPGNNRMAHNYDKLAAILSNTQTAYIMERRGRGKSGPQGDNYSIDREVEDIQAILDATNISHIFGHSYGGLIALQAARTKPGIKKLAVYEPAVSIDGSFDGSWLPQFNAAVNSGRYVQATALFLKETRLPPLSNLPMGVLRAFSLLLLSDRSGKEMRAMMPTTPAEMSEIIRLDSTGKQYETITAATLLLGGTKSPSYITDVLPLLCDIIPHASYKIISDLDHNAPDLNAPEQVARELVADI